MYEKLDIYQELAYRWTKPDAAMKAGMTYKEWNAAIMLTGAVLIGGWVAFDALAAAGWSAPVVEVARRLVWATLVMVGFNILATILVTVMVGIVWREQLKDERADERDRLVTARAMRNAYLVVSIGGALSLVLLAFGFEPAGAAYMLFAALVLAGATDAASQLVYYRLG